VCEAVVRYQSRALCPFARAGAAQDEDYGGAGGGEGWACCWFGWGVDEGRGGGRGDEGRGGWRGGWGVCGGGGVLDGGDLVVG